MSQRSRVVVGSVAMTRLSRARESQAQLFARQIHDKLAALARVRGGDAPAGRRGG